MYACLITVCEWQRKPAPQKTSLPFYHHLLSCYHHKFTLLFISKFAELKFVAETNLKKYTRRNKNRRSRNKKIPARRNKIKICFCQAVPAETKFAEAETKKYQPAETKSKFVSARQCPQKQNPPKQKQKKNTPQKQPQKQTCRNKF